MNSNRLKNVLFFLAFLPTIVLSQSFGYVSGVVRDASGNPLTGVNVQVESIHIVTNSKDSGYYTIKIPLAKTLNKITYSYLGYETQLIDTIIHPNERIHIDVILLQNSQKIEEVIVTNEFERTSGINRINMKDFRQFPNPSGNFESLIKSLPGVASSNELSSQYSVRGGSFDENLVYVNDVEVIRPFLIRTGQQEGLSFINPDMVSSVKFSAGGFEARYGDKMSSVLDVSYRKPTEYQCTASASMLGATASFEGISKNKKLSHITGVRYKTSQLLLSTLDTKGEYKPAFIDIQSLVNYQISDKVDFSFFGNFAQNKYSFIPQSRTTEFGSINQVYNLTMFFDGQEIDKYQSALGAFTVNYKPTSNLSLKLISSANASYEQETFDIDGEYYINELGNTIDSHSKDSLQNYGVGQTLSHARNYLRSNTYSVSHSGSYLLFNNQIRWSAEYKKELIDDKSNEWTLIDSAGYLSPYSASSIIPYDYFYSNNRLNLFRWQGYFQDAYQINSGYSKLFINAGLRFNYWSYNREFILSPRFRFSLKPGWNKNLILFCATGLYCQPPFFKEMVNYHGQLNPEIKAQRSIHFVIGSDYSFKMWNRPFNLTTELYYKHLYNIIPYVIDNIRIRYLGKNEAVGYSSGIDFKINGEFVPGIESWASLSLMNSKEKRSDYYLDINGNRIQPGYFPMPTDQLLNFNLFFQDYLPNNPTIQVHLNLSYGSSLPVSIPGSTAYNQTFPMGPYRRVDIGISKILKNAEVSGKIPIFNSFKEVIMSLEVFNLLDIYNKASYLWVRTVPTDENKMMNELAVPDYLTSRRLNLKISMRF